MGYRDDQTSLYVVGQMQVNLPVSIIEKAYWIYCLHLSCKLTSLLLRPQDMWSDVCLAVGLPRSKTKTIHVTQIKNAHIFI